MHLSPFENQLKILSYLIILYMQNNYDGHLKIFFYFEICLYFF